MPIDAGSGEEQDDDRQERERGDDEVEGQRRQHAAIVEPGEEHDDEDDERPLVELGRIARQTGDLGDEIACGDRVRRLEHGVGEDEVEADIEGHQRPDDVLGLGVLAASRGHRRGDLGVDHRDAGVEDAGEPAGEQRRIGAALPDREVPAHVLADEHDADAERPDMGGAEDAQQADLGAVRPDAVHGRGGDIEAFCHCRQIRCSSVMASISPSREEVSTSSG